MDNNSIGNIAVANTKLPRQRFNLSGDLHTTMDFGSVLPARCHLQIPNSKVVCSSRERILCSPLVAPTMGRLGLKAYHNFVRMSDLWPNFAPMMAQQSVFRGSSASFIPQNVPSFSLAELSVFCLYGAYLNIYNCSPGLSTDTGDDGLGAVATQNVYSGNDGVLTTDSVLSAFGLLTKTSGYASVYGISSAFALNMHYLFSVPGSVSSDDHGIPLGNPTNATFYPIDPTCKFYEDFSSDYDLDDVTPANADVVIPVTLGSNSYYFCFRLSDFGKRLRKVLIGCGYQLNFNTDQNVSLLPLFAFFKSYFDVFGLTLYQNWEQTYCYKLIYNLQVSNSAFINGFWINTAWDTTRAALRDFVYWELSRCFYTDSQDFVSAHTRSTAVSPSASALTTFINTDVDFNNGNHPNITAISTTPSEPSDLSAVNGHAYINQVLHGQLDSELLKRLYRWTNRNTIAGRRIAELLRAQGLGSYVDECKSDFIGSFDLPINIYDGVSQSDTYSPAADSGAVLGERFGTGQADSRDVEASQRNFEFECNEFGYWITLFTIVPKSGYAEALDPTVTAIGKFDFYNPEFDSLGYEASRKSLVVASQPFADMTQADGSVDDTFGYAPRYFRWKFGRNVVNGDFSRRGSRATFAPYYLDRLIDLGSRNVVRTGINSTTLRTFGVVKTLRPVDLPIAGNVWRYLTRYPFIGNFNRIFNYQGSVRNKYSGMALTNFNEFELFSRSEDNFILHCVFDVQYFAPMLAVEDSFETTDDEHKSNGSMGKA